MTFRKNLFVLITSVFLAVVGATLMGIGMPKIIEGLTLVIPTVTMALLIEDVWRKMLGQRETLTWQYFFGELLVIAATLTWFWASASATIKDMFIGLVTVFLFGVLGMFWFNLAYKPSVQTIEEKEQEQWAKLRPKVKASSQDEGVKILAYNLRYHLVGDTLDGILEIEKPLAFYDNEFMTFEEIYGATDDGTGNLQAAQKAATEYLQILTMNLPE